MLMDGTHPEIILLCLGTFQAYMIDNIQNLKLFGNKNITVIISSKLSYHLKGIQDIKTIIAESLDNYQFDQRNKMNKSIVNGLFFQASNRFFYLCNYISKNDIRNCFHIENDVMVYCNMKDYIPRIQNKVYLTMDSETRCIPGIVFFPSSREIQVLIENYEHTKNDMMNLGLFYKKHPHLCTTFPIINKKDNGIHDMFSKNFDEFKAIFDGAAIGQYLGGCHFGHKTPGFINETCIIKYNNYTFCWRQGNDHLYRPYIKIENVWIPILNLHIHCKQLNEFVASQPTRTMLSPLQPLQPIHSV